MHLSLLSVCVCVGVGGWVGRRIKKPFCLFVAVCDRLCFVAEKEKVGG